ncbi:MAG: creatininase family protein [Candidatus Promineifilaceae bacterium]
MTAFLPFSDLTWPEVAALPRDWPLVIPLGEGYDLQRLAAALGDPPEAGLLPALPFGWRGSGLEAPPALLATLLANLLESLRDDGFSRVYALTPQGLNLGLGTQALALPHSTSTHPAAARPADSERDKVVLIPIGHTEQHGLHLPLSTDTLIIEEIGRRTAEAAPDLATCLPAFPYGASTHRASFAGTLNCGGRAFEDFWLAIVEALAARGFDRFYLISGHGGNCSYLVNVVKSAGERRRRIFCATTWLHTSGRIAAPVVQATRRSARGGMGHAGELETAMILALRPDLTHMDRVVDEIDFVSTESYFMDWIEGGDLVANPPWDDDTRTGAYGAGSVATAENGRLWLETAVREKVAHVEEIHEQHRRREERREAGFGLWAGSSEQFAN